MSTKDNYSFNDENGAAKIQYLGHWNKKGIIITTGGVISELVDDNKIHTDLGNSRSVKTHPNLDYLMSNPLDKPIDKRTGVIKKFKEEDVYYPIYNKNFNNWRQKHNRIL